MSKLKITVILLFMTLGCLVSCNQQSVITSSSNSFPKEQIKIDAGVTAISLEQLPPLVSGQVIYIPIYSEIYHFDRDRIFPLTATLSIRNTDLTHSIFLETVDYYNSAGKKVRSYLTQPIQLDPLASTEVVVPSSDTTGRVGANFIVKWRAAEKVSNPIMEAIMINSLSQQGISFISPGRVIQERQ